MPYLGDYSGSYSGDYSGPFSAGGSGPVDFEYFSPFAGSESDIDLAGLAIGTSFNTWLNKVWGETGGIRCEIKSIWATPAYVCTFDSPLGSFSTGTLAGLVSTGYWRFSVVNYDLQVFADCSYTVSWDSIEAYLKLNGGSETLMVSQGFYSHTSAAGSFDGRLNCTIVDAVNTPVDAPTGIDCETDEITAWVYCSFPKGGYRWRYQSDPPGFWRYDEVIVDTGTAEEDCDTCSLALPALWDGVTMNSYNVIVEETTDWIVADGTRTPFLCFCVAGQVSGDTYHKTGEFKVKSCGPVYIKKKTELVGQERILTGWSCNDNGVLTSGDDDDTTVPTVTTCASTRNALRLLWDVYCIDQDLEPCAADEETGLTGCEGVPGDVPDTFCYYTGARQVSWPTRPGCSSGKALDYAVSRSRKQAWAVELDGRLLVRQNDNAFTLWSEFDVADAVDVVKITWDRTSVNDRLWLLTIDAGVLNLYHSTTDLGTYTSSLLSFSSDMSDLAWTENGLLLLYSIISDDLIGNVYDANLNLVMGPITTNITGIDTDSFLGIDTSMKDGKIRISATYTIGGVPVVKSSTDFTNFS